MWIDVMGIVVALFIVAMLAVELLEGNRLFQ
ncbi:hypothetical protein J2S31_002701 [Nitrospina gracilis Nb-211]|nr:hypothetical protein [Nitrospina gracilis Nb-211]